MKKENHSFNPEGRTIHIVTGGPCVGKTTILNDLKARGFHIEDEISRQVIEEQQKIDGDILPWKNINQFQVELFNRQKHIEEMLPTDKITFYDRGVADILAYCSVFNCKVPDGVREYSKPPHYQKVFILEQLDFFEKDNVRKEEPELAKKIHDAVKKAYIDLGYEVISVPPLPKKERLEWLINHLD